MAQGFFRSLLAELNLHQNCDRAPRTHGPVAEPPRREAPGEGGVVPFSRAYTHTREVYEGYIFEKAKQPLKAVKARLAEEKKREKRSEQTYACNAGERAR